MYSQSIAVDGNGDCARIPLNNELPEEVEEKEEEEEEKVVVLCTVAEIGVVNESSRVEAGDDATTGLFILDLSAILRGEGCCKTLGGSTLGGSTLGEFFNAG